MKAIQYIIGVAMVVLLAACDDDFNDDKAVISSIDKGYIYVNQEYNAYNLYWSTPRIYTSNGNAVVSKYEVCVARADGDDNMWGETERDYVPVMTTTELGASVSPEMVAEALGVNSPRELFLFAVRVPGNNFSGGVLCTSEALGVNSPRELFLFAVRVPGNNFSGGVLCLSEEVVLNYHDGEHVYVYAYSSDDSKGYVEGGEFCDKNAEIELHAIPYQGYKFVGWKEENKGDIFSTSNPIRITADYDVTFVAVFE